MTVARIDGLCAAWTYEDERGDECWKVIVRAGDQWLELDEGGVSYGQTPESLRKFMADWLADVELDGDDGGPSPDTEEVYEQAARFIEEHQ